ncbi:MAG TPA: hypothetical protein VGH27_28925 [Streptosporangiaceae bacterium]|jgi:hypothetical protein
MRLPRRTSTAQNTSAAPAWTPSHQWQRPELVIWGAHGGAGTTTLATWLQPAWDMGAMRPQPDPPYPARVAHGRPLLVTCRCTATAARLATAAVAAVNRQGGHVAVLVIVSDGWPEPATATSRFRLLEPQVMTVVRIPFVPQLRLADDPAAVPLPHRARRALDLIQTATGRRSPTP